MPSITNPEAEAGNRGGAVLKTIWPGQAGSIKLARRFGVALVCVRYRRSADGLQRRTTVELVVEETPIRLNGRLQVRLPPEANLRSLRARAQALGAAWDPQRRVWLMTPRVARALGLERYAPRPQK